MEVGKGPLLSVKVGYQLGMVYEDEATLVSSRAEGVTTQTCISEFRAWLAC